MFRRNDELFLTISCAVLKSMYTSYMFYMYDAWSPLKRIENSIYFYNYRIDQLLQGNQLE